MLTEYVEFTKSKFLSKFWTDFNGDFSDFIHN